MRVSKGPSIKAAKWLKKTKIKFVQSKRPVNLFENKLCQIGFRNLQIK